MDNKNPTAAQPLDLDKLREICASWKSGTISGQESMEAGQEAANAKDAARYRWIRKNVISMSRTPAEVDADLREKEWTEWERSADVHIENEARAAMAAAPSSAAGKEGGDK
jgi:hypothetical protein